MAMVCGQLIQSRDYLPKDKQFLISCGVPSLRRVSQIEKGVGVGLKEDDEKLMSFDESGADADEDEQWVATHYDQQRGSSSRAADMVDIPDIGEDQLAPEHQLTEGQEDDLAARVAGVSIGNAGTSSSANDIGDIPDMPDIPDMDDETDDLAGGIEEEDDPATAAVPATTRNTATSSAGGDNGKLLSVRKYDCIITYDKYYQTPRMWLVATTSTAYPQTCPDLRRRFFRLCAKDRHHRAFPAWPRWTGQLSFFLFCRLRRWRRYGQHPSLQACQRHEEGH